MSKCPSLSQTKEMNARKRGARRQLLPRRLRMGGGVEQMTILLPGVAAIGIGEKWGWGQGSVIDGRRVTFPDWACLGAQEMLANSQGPLRVLTCDEHGYL